MSVYRVFRVKWYHVILGIFGLLGLVFILAWFVLAKKGPAGFVEDEADIVS